MCKPREGDVILLPFGTYEALKVIQAEEQKFQTYLNMRSALNELKPEELDKLSVKDYKQGVSNSLRSLSNNPRVHTSLAAAMLFEMKGEIDEAIERLKQANKAEFSPHIYFRLGLLYDRQVDHTKAIYNYNEGKKCLNKKVGQVAKLRPVLLLRQAPKSYRNLPPEYSYFLCCGLSSSTMAKNNYIEGFDEKVKKNADQLKLGVDSVIRLGFLEWIPIPPLDDSQYHLGSISVERHKRLLGKLGCYMRGRLVIP